MIDRRRNILGVMGTSPIDWESIARGMIDFSTPFEIDLALATEILTANTALSTETFYNRANMTKFEIPSNISAIGGYALRGCTGLTNITIPSSVTQILSYAFANCTNLV